MDAIVIEGLTAKTRVGATDEERAEPQGVVVDLVIGLDLGPAGRSDELEQTVDYAAVTQEVGEFLASASAALLEHLAEQIAGILLAHNGVDNVSVNIAKEYPPVRENVRGIAVRIERKRS